MIADMPVETRVYLPLAIIACVLAGAGAQAPGLPVQIGVLAFGIIVFGLPHGALDPLVALRAGLMRSRSRVVMFHLAYGAAAGGVLLAWNGAPAAALAGFLVASAYHFAGDWFRRGVAARLLLGSAILSLPAAAHTVEVATLYAVLSGDAAPTIAEIQARLAPAWLIIVLTAILALARGGRGAAALELCAIAATAWLLPPLVFFGLYFCSLHSPRHFLTLWRSFDARRASALCAAAYTGLAAMAAAIAWAMAATTTPDMSQVSAASVQIVFMGLAALTAPHMIVTTLADRNTPLKTAHATLMVNTKQAH